MGIFYTFPGVLKIKKFYKTEPDESFQIPFALPTKPPVWYKKHVEHLSWFPKYIYPSKEDILWVGKRGEQVTSFEVKFRNKKFTYGVDREGEYFLCAVS